jgi:hypothetical protein
MHKSSGHDILKGILRRVVHRAGIASRRSTPANLLDRTYSHIANLTTLHGWGWN